MFARLGVWRIKKSVCSHSSWSTQRNSDFLFRPLHLVLHLSITNLNKLSKHCSGECPHDTKCKKNFLNGVIENDYYYGYIRTPPYRSLFKLNCTHSFVFKFKRFTAMETTVIVQSIIVPWEGKWNCPQWCCMSERIDGCWLIRSKWFQCSQYLDD